MHRTHATPVVVATVMIAALVPLQAAQTQEIHNPSVRRLVGQLQSTNPVTRCEAASELGRMRSQAEEAIDALGQATGDTDQNVRRAAALALFRIGPEAMERLPWMRKIGLKPITSQLAAQTFDQVWRTVDREYPMFILRPDVDWEAVRDAYRPQALEAESDTELATLVADMLAALQDLHVWVKIRGTPVPVYRRDYTDNWNRNGPIYEKLVGHVHRPSKDLFWAETADGIGWIVVTRWSDVETPDHFDDTLEQMRDTHSLIVDVRSNTGGDSMLASLVAGRFTDVPRAYMDYRYRNGPKHTDLTETIRRQVAPRGPWAYDRPVILLQGRRCLSANESFCAQMRACPNVTTMGGPTRGSTGFPVWFRFPAGIEVAVPQWVVYLPEGQAIDYDGVPPDILSEWRQNAFEGEKDELLSAALQRLRQTPGPTDPIRGMAVAEFRAKQEAERTHQPKVVSVQPADGASDVPPQTKLRIRFDRPMRASTAHLHWTSGGVRECDRIRYDEGTHEFVIPVRLQPAHKHSIIIKPSGSDGAGFQSAHGTAAMTYTWSFRTSPAAQHRKTPSAERSAASPTVDAIIREFNETRRQTGSFIEQVDTIECANAGPSGFTTVRAYAAAFHVYGPTQYLADVSDLYGAPMIVFSEGSLNHICGYYRHKQNEPELVFCMLEDVTRQSVRVADPFDSQRADPDMAIDTLALRCGGRDDLAGRPCHVIESWADATEGAEKPGRCWWIDAETDRLVHAVDDRQAGRHTRSWFTFTNLNKPLDGVEILPGIPYQQIKKHIRPADPLGDGYEGRFVDISDGCDGRITARWGRYGSGAEEQSVGL